VLNATNAEQLVNVFGDDYPTRDGTCVRDYTHVSDIAMAHVLSLRVCKDSEFRAFNLGTGLGHSVLEIIQMAESVTGRRVNRVLAPRRPGDPAELIASPAKARAELGWCTEHSELQEIVSTAWAWMQKQ
jgi:UDP-glucose 4-epimerase